MTPRDNLNALAVVDSGLDQLLALDPEVAQAATADRAALFVDWTGFRDLCADSPKILDSLPKPRDGELAQSYVARIWPLLEPGERGAALELGLQKMVTMQRISEVGIQLRVWRAYVSGDWTNSPECCDTFREWVQHALTDTLDGSSSEATQLANVVEAVAWCADNDIGWLPRDDDDNLDLEACFRRPFYRRWRAVAARILDRAKILRELEASLVQKQREKAEVEARELQAAVSDVEQEIKGLVEMVADQEGHNTKDLDQAGRQRPPRLPPIVARKNGKDPMTGRTTITMEVSPAQEIVLQQKGKGWLDLLLEGEQYNREEWDYWEYRMNGDGQWQRRIMVDNDWPQDTWEDCGGPKGSLDIVAYTVPEVTVLHVYEKKEGKE
jgi:DNA-binding protein H-NS